MFFLLIINQFTRLGCQICLQAWSQKLLPSPYGGASRAFLQAILSMGLYTYLTPRFSVSRIFEPQYKSWGFWARLGYQWLAGFTVRWKYYFIWSLAETSVIISGFGFSGWSESCPGKPKWDRARNVDIIGVELAETSAVLPLVWNIHVSTWLRLCILSNPCIFLIVLNSKHYYYYYFGKKLQVLHCNFNP